MSLDGMLCSTSDSVQSFSDPQCTGDAVFFDRDGSCGHFFGPTNGDSCAGYRLVERYHDSARVEQLMGKTVNCDTVVLAR
jgi:hypothetical protein